MLVRPSEAGPELLFVLRPGSMRIFAGFHAFPGGALEPGDYSDLAAEISALTPEEAEQQMPTDAADLPAFGFFVCALREVFEEVGILYADDGEKPADLPASELRRARARLLEDESPFPEIVKSLGLRLATHRLRFHSRWTAPEALPVRFDARFFVAPARGEPDPYPAEVAAVDWKTPSQILALAEAGAVMLAPPTAATIGSLVRYPSSEALLDGGRSETQMSAPIERHSRLVRRLVAPNASLMTGPGTNTYIVGEGRVIVIDPGSMEPSHIDALVSAGKIATIVVTHGHADHFSGALELAQKTGAELAASPKFMRTGSAQAYRRRLSEGEFVEAGGARLLVMETPGHASDHICLWLEQEKALFSGDLVLGEGTTVISPPDGDLVEYLASLEKVAALEVERLYPGHFTPRDDAREWISWYVAHRKEREGQILAALGRGATTIPEIVELVYSTYPTALHPIAERSVLAHLLKLQSEEKVTERDGGYLLESSG